VLLEAAVLTQQIPVVGEIDDEGILGMTGAVEGIEHAANAVIEELRRGVIRVSAAALLSIRQILENQRDLRRILRSWFWRDELGRRVPPAILHREIVRRVRFVKADDQKERLVPRPPHEPLGLTGEVNC
jgi:hypothetical protein